MGKSFPVRVQDIKVSNTEREEMKEKYCQIIKEIIIEIDPSTKDILKNGNLKLIEDLGFDSISLMTLLIEIENRFNIKFGDEMIIVNNIETINKLSELVENMQIVTL